MIFPLLVKAITNIFYFPVLLNHFVFPQRTSNMLFSIFTFVPHYPFTCMALTYFSTLYFKKFYRKVAKIVLYNEFLYTLHPISSIVIIFNNLNNQSKKLTSGKKPRWLPR